MRLKTAVLAPTLIGVGALLLIAGSVMLVMGFVGLLAPLVVATGLLSVVAGMALQMLD